MSNLNQTPSASRLQIAIFGRRNAGKSSLINSLTNQTVALVSEHAGTTTDPVVKAMELLPLGPVVVIDTAGLDDKGDLGKLRVQRTYEVLDRTDLAVLVLDSRVGVTNLELEVLQTIRAKGIPVVGAINKTDLPGYQREERRRWQQQLQLDLVEVAAVNGAGIAEVKAAIIQAAPAANQEPSLAGDLIKPGAIALLVVPIDSAAPKGRLILPQQQVVRDILDHDGIAFMTKEERLQEVMSQLAQPPAIVITDSQVFKKVAAATPPEIPLTSFSILFARYKGDLAELVQGARAIEQLQPGDRVLIAEGCTHHRQSDDIGTVKIPRWLQQRVGGALQLEWASGQSLPENLSRYRLIVHCGACMLNRRGMTQRIEHARAARVPIVNYGVLIAYLHGILLRALEPLK